MKKFQFEDASKFGIYAELVFEHFVTAAATTAVRPAGLYQVTSDSAVLEDIRENIIRIVSEVKVILAKQSGGSQYASKATSQMALKYARMAVSLSASLTAETKKEVLKRLK